jgi:hypothetical protein
MPRPVKFKKASDDKSGAALRERALERLKANWMLMQPHATWQAELEPRITPMLNSVDGGIAHCVEALRAHDEDDARLFLGVWDRCSATDRKYLKVEEIAHAAGVGALRLAEVVQTALFLYGNMQTQMMLAAGLPQIVSRSIRQAKTAKGLADREWMLKAGKILPIPKGAQIAIQNNMLPSRETPQLEPSYGWKYPEQRLKEIAAITNPKLLEAGKTNVEPIHITQNEEMVFER